MSARTRVALTAALVFAGAAVGLMTGPGLLARQAGAAEAAAARTRLTAVVEPVIGAVWKGYDQNAAMDHVRFINQYWRLSGNPGYNATVDRIQKRLESAGIATRIDEYPNGGPAWDYSIGTLALVIDGKDQIVLSREQDRVALCINSFSTAPEGVVAPLIDVGRGTDQDFAGKIVKGAVVLGDADAGALWRRAVTTGGAIGVISTSLPAYLNADAPGAKPTPKEQWGILQWGSVPYDEARKAFGFKASPRAATTLRKRLAEAAGAPVSVRVTVASTFATGPARTLVAEIPGRSAAAERIVMAAHIQEPGANDNASGVGTLAEAAVALAAAIRSKAVAAPERTLTFLFLNEISGSRRWIQDHPAEAKQTRYMFSLDMTGEDVTKTGGTFLVERYPDPGAVYTRTWDPHTEWGAGSVRAESLKGDLINDAHLFVLQQVATRSKWVVKTNPYEGGSDHTEFQRSGIPSVLDWHFTDRYYHTNLDTPDKTSPEEMRNVGVSVATSAWLFASATASMAIDVGQVVAEAGRARISVEQTEGGKLAAAAADSAAARSREATIVAAWKKWYAEAVRSTSRLVVGTPPASFTADVEKIAVQFESSSSGSPSILAAAWLSLIAPSHPPSPTRFGVAGPAPFALSHPRALALSHLESPQALKASFQGSPVFICGVDEQIQPIAVTWMAMVLIGDDKMYVPCPRQLNSLGYPIDSPHPLEHRENREAVALGAGRRATNVEIKWRAAQALMKLRGPVSFSGRSSEDNIGPQANEVTIQVDSTLGSLQPRPFGVFIPVCNAEPQYFGQADKLRRWQAGPLFRYLIDTNVAIRKDAAYLIGTRMAVQDLQSDLVAGVMKEFYTCWLKQTDTAVQAVMLETLGVIRYANTDQLRQAEAFLIKESQGPHAKVLGAVKGLEALVRLHPQPGPIDATRARLRELVSFGNRIGQADYQIDARIRRLALTALMTARDTDMQTYLISTSDDDFQMRRLIASRLNLGDQTHVPLAQVLAVDPEFQVRYDFLSSVGRWVTTTKLCQPLADRFKDPSPAVAMRAMDLMSPACTDLADIVPILVEAADKLTKPGAEETWHIPSRALATLARVSPAEAKSRLAFAAKFSVWQVRAAVATSAVPLNDPGVAISLMADPEANVRNAALESLMRLKSPAAFEQAIATLQTATDYQLLRTAALALHNVDGELKAKSVQALLDTMRRVTDEETDTSRDVRLAILDRLAEVLPVERSSDLLAWTVDYDDEVIEGAKKAFTTLVGTEPAQGKKRRRYPYQPSVDLLGALPNLAMIELETGVVTLQLLPDAAPVTVARFVELVNAHFYEGLTFHRIVPNFVVQGGSPGANEYVGTSRFMRDEVGPLASHLRGAVGISSRGTDSGDAQIFIDLVDLPRLDRDYTVFAYVIKGMELVDAMLDGAKIKNIVIKK